MSTKLFTLTMDKIVTQDAKKIRDKRPGARIENANHLALIACFRIVQEVGAMGKIAEQQTSTLACWGPVYTTVEKCTGRSRALAQYMVIWGKGWYAGEDERQLKCSIQVGVLRRSDFLSKALRSPKKLDLRKTPLLESATTLASLSFFHPWPVFSTKGLLAVV